MKIKNDFITNSSSTSFILESTTTIKLLNRNIQNENYNKTLIHKDGGDQYEDELFKSFGFIMKNEGHNLIIEINGFLATDYSLKKLNIVSTGKNLRCIEKCLNKIDKKIKLPDDFNIHFKQTVDFQGDGWDGGDYRFSGQGYVFQGNSHLAKQKLTMDIHFECLRNNKGKICLDFPKFLLKLGN